MKRFIAGATCSACGAVDKIVMYDNAAGERIQECVKCGFIDSLTESAQPAENIGLFEPMLNKPELNKPELNKPELNKPQEQKKQKLSARRPASNEVQVLNIVDAGKSKK